jgi:CRISPR-associated protein Csm3
LIELRSGILGKRKKTDGSPLSLRDLNNLSEEKEREECANILKLFGISGADQDDTGEIGPSRISFADCPLDENWKRMAFEKNLAFTEVKSENSIDRIKGIAQNPRFTERVPSDVEFRFSLTVKFMEGDSHIEELLFDGLKLLELDALGGSGSRGYGRLRFEFDNPEDQERFDSKTPL